MGFPDNQNEQIARARAEQLQIDLQIVVTERDRLAKEVLRLKKRVNEVLLHESRKHGMLMSPLEEI